MRGPRVFAVFVVFSLALSVPGRSAFAAGEACEEVCARNGGGVHARLKAGFEEIFNAPRVCTVPGGGGRGDFLEGEPGLAEGARSVGYAWVGGCRLNRPVREEISDSIRVEGSEALVKQAYRFAGIQSRSGCKIDLPHGAKLQDGDVLRLRGQAIVLTSVGEDPFGIDSRFKSGVPPPVRKLAGEKKALPGAVDLCRDWLLETSRYQLSLLFLSSEGDKGVRVRAGSFESLVGEDHGGSEWSLAFQDWALSHCVDRVLAAAGVKTDGINLPAGSLRVERALGRQAKCRIPLPRMREVNGGACGRCCLKVEGARK